MQGKLVRRNGLICVITFVVAILCATAAPAQFEPVPMGTTDAQGVPDYLEPVGDVIPSSFYEWLDIHFPEMTALDLDSLPSTVGQELHFTQPSDVWMTFVSEGAGWRNSIGYYTYDTGSPPTTVDDIESAYSVFPNFSAVDRGGGLESGDKVYLGNFAAGTSLGTYLTQNGWSESYARDTVFSTALLNPESDPALQRHVVSVYDEVHDLFVIGYEDLPRDHPMSDDDFNDAVFYFTVQGKAYTGTQTVPEPCSIALLGFAAMGLCLVARGRRNR